VIDGPRLLSGIRDDASSTVMQSIFNGIWNTLGFMWISDYLGI
jgi:hypothetical protein